MVEQFCCGRSLDVAHGNEELCTFVMMMIMAFYDYLSSHYYKDCYYCCYCYSEE